MDKDYDFFNVTIYQFMWVVTENPGLTAEVKNLEILHKDMFLKAGAS